ncbi:RNA polymerase sigma factor [Pedobacter africanus]|uniref:RNA polymerase sigma-70 factor, ECF subfamily n=1 Tax=Pedobacter africanus TaxID=151894 RepID=A0A1W1ZB30_9SPHI|nr:sigma-70 family RNA polymerase sigma factor [Pedobacter africanus]SMC45536.1 RNA polymerase sigma-70 factor, ECF subfamily [Pedobacter africanus]
MTVNTVLANETELLQQAANGDANAFALLYSHYRSLVYRFIYKYLKSPQLTDDLTQEIFLKVWKNKEALTDRQAFKSYLFTISRNHTLNFLKRASIDNTAKSVIINSYSPSGSLEEELQTKDYLAYLQSILVTLTPQSREVFRLCRQEYKSYDEAAEILGISRSAVKKHMIKSMKVLGDAVKRDLGIPLGIFLTVLLK